ncbi:hypothetical protein [Spirosoma foliorum]|uniref:Uncharacterized protein n=1 Tax=Spirosoma foliorum TaxID=2710596 RepID=A0A7G5H2K5_9BACT|nr:hypothetical protein [Spirosoma foliorum]QMW05347.1 hypothetical protein H3H32_10880 [Spirosoma foliorum]
MSQLTSGVTFDLGDGWLYAQESDTAFVPGDFTANPIFPRDKDGNYFVTGAEYRLWAKHPIEQPDALLYAFKVNEDQSLNILYGGDATSITKSTDTTNNNNSASALTLQQILQNGPVADTMPYLNGGLAVNLDEKPDGAYVIVGDDGVLYKVASNAQDITSIVFDNFEHYQFVPDAGALPDAYIGRFDFNNCGTNGNPGQAGGWFANTNYPLVPVVVRVERDGIFYKNVTADRPRGNDVRLYLQNQGLVTTSRENFSWIVDKSPDDNDGKPHTYRFFGGTSSVEASSDTGAENAITCGTPAPYIVQYVLLASATVAGGAEGNARMKANYSDSSEAPYIGAGTYSKQGSWPAGAVVTPGASATAKVGNPIGTTPIDRVVTLRFTLPGDGTSYAEETLTLLASGLLGVKYEVVVNAGNSSLRDLTYYLKSTVDVAAKTYVNGTLVDTATQITPSIVDAGGYTRKSYIQGQNVGAIIKHEFYYVDGTVVIFEHTVTLGSAVTLNAIYP